MKTAAYTSPAERLKIALAIAAACLLAYAGTLKTRDFIHDDRWIIDDNSLLRQGADSLPAVWTTGYWEAVQGRNASVQEYRPLLMTTFLLHYMTTGASPLPMHAANLLLHMTVCFLLWEALRSRMTAPAAAAAALFYAVLPIHTEAVSALTGRSEVLSAALMLGAWLSFDRGKPAPGAVLFSCALLTKEHSLLFPVFLALSDWTFCKKSPAGSQRRGVYILLAASSVVYLIIRKILLTRTFHVGESYFAGSSPLEAVLTVSRFVLRRYVWPTVAGVGQCTDFSRPLIPDSAVSSLSSWACLAVLAAIAGASLWALARKRSPWSFWVLAPSLFLLPTSHLLVPIDTLGAERFLYFPTLGLAALFGQACAALRAKNRLWSVPCGILLLWYAARAAARNQVWQSGRLYYEAAVACNPLSGGARSALGTYLITSGNPAEGSKHLRQAAALAPHLAHPHYNLGRLAWERGQKREAELLLRRSIELDPNSSDAWNLLSLVVESQGREKESLECLRKALEIRPWDPLAHFNLGRRHLLKGRADLALPHLIRFTELSPDDPQTKEINGLIRSIQNGATTKPQP